MKIIHYIPSIDQSSGGVGAYLKLLAHSLGKITELHIITHHSENELKIENCTIHYIEHRLIHIFQAKRQFLNLIDDIKPDILHVNSCWEPLCSYTVFWAKSKNYPVVITPHGMLEPWVLAKNYWKKKLPALLFYQKYSLKMADVLVATAETEKNNLLKLGYNKDIKIVPNGVITDNTNTKKSWKRTQTILYVGLLRPNKGANILLEAVGLLKNQLKGYKIFIAGPDTEGYLKTLKELSIKLNIENIVYFLGGVFGKEKWELYKQADIFILPTLNENFGIVIAEALLSGTPVITCKGAPWQGIVEHRCGWWVNRTVKDIANAINESLSLSEQELEAMGKRGRNYVIKRFSSNIVAENMKQLYQQIVEKSYSTANVKLTNNNKLGGGKLSYISLQSSSIKERRAA